MKKLSPVLCAVLLGGCISLAACSGAVVSDNYREPTASELDDALSSIDDAHLFGDPLDSARSYGITVSGEVSGSFNSIAQSSTSEEKLDYSISASGNTLAGEGTYSRSEESLGVTTDIQAKLYNDSDYFYFDYQTGDQTQDAKYIYPVFVQVHLPKLLQTLGCGIFSAGLASADEDMSVRGFISALYDIGMKIEMDDGDGVKLKCTASGECLEQLVSLALDGVYDLSFEKSTLELYLYIDRDGIFEQCSVLQDLQYDGYYIGVSFTGSSKGEFIARRSDREVTLPAELTDDEKFPTREETNGQGELIELPVTKPQSTSDGVVTALDYSAEEPVDILYDTETDSIIVVGPDTATIYDAQTGERILQKRSQLGFTCADVDQGILCIGTGTAKQICVIDLKTGSDVLFPVSVNVSELAVIQERIAYCDDDQWCEIYTCSLDGNEVRYVCTAWRPLFTANRGAGVIYAASDDGRIACIDPVNGTIVWETSVELPTVIERAPAIYDGELLHFYHYTLDPATGARLSEDAGDGAYPPQVGYHPETTLLITNSHSYVRSTTGDLLIFDRGDNAFVYRADFTVDRLYECADGTLLVIGAAAGYAAIVDPARI